MYLTAGNFPSRAANTIQVAKMAAAYTGWLPHLEVVALTGLLPFWYSTRPDLCQTFGLARPLNMKYLPLLIFQKDFLFSQSYRPPAWFPPLVGHYARWRHADLVFTRKDNTAMVTVRAGVPTVLETHLPWVESSPQLKAHPELFRSSHLRSLVVITQPIADSFIQAGVPPAKILVLPDGVDLIQFAPNLDKIEARQRLGLERDTPMCMYAGHLHPGRGIEEIFAAAGQLPHIQFIFVGGWDKDVEKHRNIAQRNGLNNVMFQGYVPHAEVPLYLFAADILLMPYSATLITADRCSPLKMFEYLAAGRPIISSNLPILHSVLRPEENALLIQPDSAAELTQAIIRILAEPNLAEHLSQNARRDSQQYSWDERAQRILQHALKEEN
jgi:glycosyltransferase involved in cell wall biosynthesis